MSPRRLGMSEARRLLPAIAEALAREGGRVDVTYRGQARISIVRTADLADHGRGGRDRGSAARAALDVEFVTPAEDLVQTIEELRAKVGKARKLPKHGPGKRAR